MMTKHLISQISKGSIAEGLGIIPGDFLLSINDNEIIDVFDYRYLTQDSELKICILTSSGEEKEFFVKKEEDEELGLQFEEGLMDEYRSCTNKCIFCFIDQMPKGMRKTLYFKDDDMRLSFLQGNYVTLTNLSEKDIERIIKYRLEPINISFQTTNPSLRCMMLNNRFAGDALKKADTLFNAGITMNGQIVLCKGVNDKEELERSISDLYKYVPVLESLSVVPVGLSKYREGLYPLEPFNKEDAKAVLDTIHKWQEKAYKEHNTHFVHASDEWYILADEELPEEDKYDGYLQIENGVGMLRSFIEEFDEGLSLLNEALNAYKPSFFNKINIHIIQCDNQVRSDTVIRDKDEFSQFMNEYTVIGFGSTDFRPVFDYVDEMIENEQFSDLKGLIYFTDGYGIYPETKKNYDVAFVFLSDDENAPKVPPWAIKVILTEEDIMINE